VVINLYGDKIDPTRTSDMFVEADPVKFCEDLMKLNARKIKSKKNSWHENIKKINSAIEQIKDKMIFKGRFPFEGRILTEVYSLLPDKSNLFLSNSLPVRDFDYFASAGKKINLFYNRGASGIDGIIATACGAANNSGSATTLVIGDLAFYHDLSSLYLCRQLKNPFVIILINNDGGAIFEMLPIAGEKVEFKKYFKTPVKVNYSKTIKAFNINYFIAKSWAELKTQYHKALNSNISSVIEIKTNSIQSLELRRKFWNESKLKVDKMINENKAR
jgi:2-succinyl-5-enolpyruvyl-6-hydroxy-3-cyclohexene-1-carboxylate synthase